MSALAISCRTTVSNVRRAAAIHPAYNNALIPNVMECCSLDGNLSYHCFPAEGAFGPFVLWRVIAARSVPSTSMLDIIEEEEEEGLLLVEEV